MKTSTKRTLSNSGRRIVVTGYGAVTPVGNDVESTWSAILEGKSGAAPITQFDASGLTTTFACEVKNFDASQYINKKELRRMDRFIQIGLSAALQAIDQSGLSIENVPADRIGCLLTSGMGGLGGIEEASLLVADRPDRLSPFFIPSVIINLFPGQISIMKGFRGPNYSMVSACSSSAHAVGEAMRLIERGDCEAVLCGGAEASITKIGIAGFCAMRALSSRNDAPEKASRPFDLDRDGFVMGEGAGVLVLESLESAEKRGAKILGELVGYAANADAYHMTSPSEGGSGAADCMRLALQDAGLEKTSVEHINMHGTSTSTGDVAESQGIVSLFGDHAKNINCVSTKSMTGHLLGAAGAVETILSVMAVERGTLPGTINLDRQDPQCPLNYTAHEAVKRQVSVALSNSFGFGGTNASIVVKKFS